MRRKSFTWRYPNGVIITFPSYHKAARILGISVTSVRWYAEHNIHSEADKKQAKKRVKI